MISFEIDTSCEVYLRTEPQWQRKKTMSKAEKMNLGRLAYISWECHVDMFRYMLALVSLSMLAFL